MARKNRRLQFVTIQKKNDVQLELIFKLEISSLLFQNIGSGRLSTIPKGRERLAV